jgi:hypothetical protein
MVASDVLGDGGSRPVPDPTELTSRAVEALRTELWELFEARLKGLELLADERFRSLSAERETAERLRLEQKADTKVAVDAALAALKESNAQQAAAFAAETAKTERNFTDQLKAQRDTFGTAIAGQTTRYDDLDKRLTRIESVRVGGQELKAGFYAAASIAVALVIAAIAGIALVISQN